MNVFAQIEKVQRGGDDYVDVVERSKPWCKSFKSPDSNSNLN